MNEASNTEGNSSDWSTRTERAENERLVKEDVLALIRKHGAWGTILGLSRALRALGTEWCGDDGPATGIEAVTGYSPYRADDWRSAAK